MESRLGFSWILDDTDWIVASSDGPAAQRFLAKTLQPYLVCQDRERSRSLPMQLGELQFTDGTTRPVFRWDDGRQFVIDDDGKPAGGVGLHPDEYQGHAATRWGLTVP